MNVTSHRVLLFGWPMRRNPTQTRRITPVAEDEDPILAEQEPEQGKVVIPKEIYSITEGEAIDMIMPSYYDENASEASSAAGQAPMA